MPYIPPSPSSPPLAQGGIYHRIERGQTLWRIAQIYDVDIDTLKRVNHIHNPLNIEVGQEIFIPGATKRLDIARLPILPDKREFIWPVRGEIIRHFSLRKDRQLNKGIDIQLKSPIEIKAARSGRVSFLNNNFGGYGKTVILDHYDGFFSVYSNLSEILVDKGELVPQGGYIGRIDIGSKDAYLHFEIRRGYKPIDPLDYLSGHSR